MRKRKRLLLVAMMAGAVGMLGPGAGAAAAEAGTPEMDATDFVSLAEAVPDVILEIRYYSTYNFVGDRIDGYEEPCALLTKEAAEALKGAAADAQEQGYMLKIYDAYRPQMAVDNFIAWAEDIEDTRMKEYFYPELDKSVLFDQGYIAEKSGHSRGSTLDLTLFDMDAGKELDMGGTFDYFGELSHPDYVGDLTEEQIQNRNILRDIMVGNGFKPLDTEWWHFTLENEPYPDTYFAFPVREESVSASEADDTLADAGIPAADEGGAAEASQDMVQCEFCGGWYEAGNVFRNHICPERDAAYAPEESD